jgi:hypothetical protein
MSIPSIIAGAILITSSGLAMASDCASRIDPRSQTFVLDLLACLKSLENEANELRNRPVSELVPRGAVVAFDRDDLTEDICPTGWVPFLEARAHVIVGAGDPSKSPGKMAYDERRKPLQGYVLRQHGGEQTYADFSTLNTETGVAPHSNVFPYLALYYCKKS